MVGVGLHLLNNFSVSEGAAVLDARMVLGLSHVLHEAAWCQTPLRLLAAGFGLHARSSLLQQLCARLLQLRACLQDLHAHDRGFSRQQAELTTSVPIIWDSCNALVFICIFATKEV